MYNALIIIVILCLLGYFSFDIADFIAEVIEDIKKDQSD